MILKTFEGDTNMKKHIQLLLPLCLLWSYTLFYSATAAFAANAANYNAIPPFVTTGASPNVLLELSIETPMQGAAYNDQPVTGTCAGRVSDGGTDVGRCYFTDQDYLGIFDPKKEYKYDSANGNFYPVGYLNTDHSTKANGYSGNFLNWTTMTAIDEFRWALTGGNRTTDTTTLTVIQRANMTLSLDHSWYPEKRIKSNDNVAPGTVTPFSVTAGTPIYLYNHGYQLDIGTSQGGHEKAQNLNISAKVCDPAIGLEDNCNAYKTSGDVTYYKPEGLIQNNADKMRFAVMSYALDSDQSRGGGVLRATMKYVGQTLPDGTDNPRKEFGADGIFIADPDDSVLTGTNKALGNSGVINYVNKFGANGYKSYDPIGELFYESLNYFKHRGRTPEYADGLSAAAYDGFPVITDWDDPIQSWCQNNFIIGINDANPWLDKKLPGTYFTAATFNGHSLSQGNDYGEPGNPDHDYSVRTLTNTVGQLEGINGTQQKIGCTAANCDMADTLKNIPGLGEVMGTHPYTPKENSYYVAGLAYYAHTQDIRSDLPGRQTITTFMIDTQEYNADPLVGKMNMLWLAGKYGGFVEKDFLDTNGDGNVYEPNLLSEWANPDGTPTNYVLASDPDKLVSGLAAAFDNVNKQSAAGTAASVISGSRSGEGAVYQSVFFPELPDATGNRITWAGSVHALFVDALGRIREDTNGNGILDINDKVIVYKKDASNVLTVEKYSLVSAVQEVTSVTLRAAASITPGTYFRLNTVDEKYYVWFTINGSGTDPKPASDTTGIAVALLSGDDATTVAKKTGAVLALLGNTFQVPVPTTPTMTVTNFVPGVATDATAGTSGVTVSVVTQGAGETTQLFFTGTAADINYLWNSDTWLNGISDANITLQRDYTKVEQKRYIFTFIDANQNMVANSGETLPFVATSLPSVADLSNASTLWPYIPVNFNSTTLPAYVVDPVVEITNVTLPAAASALAGKYFLVNSVVGHQFYVWFKYNTNGTDPGLAGMIGIQVTTTTSQTAIQVAQATQAAIVANATANTDFSIPVPTTSTITITNAQKGSVVDASTSYAGFTISVTQQGADNNRTQFLQNQAQRVVNYIRGQDQGTTAITGATIPEFRSRQFNSTTWRLGDIVYSSPTAVSKPMEALHLLYKDTSYATFVDQYKQRRTVIYTGANDGMLHAFNGGFYEDRFDVFPNNLDPLDLDPNVGDGIRDATFLTQPKNASGATITGPLAHPLGAELWAYVPYNLLPHLYWLTDPNYGHVYYVDLKPRVFDAKIFPVDADHPGGWGTVLVGGMRFGGGKIGVDMDRTNTSHPLSSSDRTMASAYFVLDITNPEVPPRVLGEFNFPGLGYTTCYPTTAAIKDRVETGTSPNNWYLIFGSGPAEVDGSPGTNAGYSLPLGISKQSAKLYVVDLVQLAATNGVLKTLNTSGVLDSSAPWYYKNFTGDKNAFISDPITVDFDLNYKADAVYFGTVSYDSAAAAGQKWGGKLRRIVMQKDIAPAIVPTDTTTWNSDSVLMDLETTLHQPITAAPAIGVDPDGNNWVFFGTGRYLVGNDASIADQEAFYGIKEPKSVFAAGPPQDLRNSYATVLSSNLINSTTIEVNASSGLVSGGVSPNTWTNATWSSFLSDTKARGGWLYNFTDPKERNISQAALFGDLLTFTSYVPSIDICAPGSSFLYGLYYLTGTAPFTAVLHDALNPTPVNNLKRISLGVGLASKPSIHVGTKDGSTAFVQTSDGAIIPIGETNPGMTKSGRTSWSSYRH